MTESKLRTWAAAARPRTLPAAVAPVLVGSALAWRAGAFDAAAAALCLGFALLVQIGTNLANDYHDFVRGADTETRVGPRRAVAAGLISAAAMRAASIGVLAAAFFLGLGLVAWGGPLLIVVGLVCIAAGYLYTGGPFPLAYLGLGDVFVFIFFGLVAVCVTFYVQAGGISRDAVLAAVPVGLLTANILVVNNYRDAETDAAAGKRTLVVRLGRPAARAQFVGSLVFAGLIPIAFASMWQSALPLLPLLLAPVAWRHAGRLTPNASPRELIRLLEDTGKLLALYSLLFSLGLAL